MTGLTIGSLFSGIGGLELGLERAGFGPVLWQAESDAYCRSVLRRHWPGARRFHDVRSIKQGRVEVPDVICGGFPCQDISLAGTGAGLDGERSGLWHEYARIISELRPRCVIVENVSALRRRGLNRVLGDLAACGYDATWDCIPAAAVGAPHRRDRLFVVAWRIPDSERDAVRHESERGEGGAQAAIEWSAKSEHLGGPVANGHGGGRKSLWLAGGEPGHEGSRGHVVDGCDVPQWPPAPDDMHAWGRVPTSAQPAFCGVADGVPDRLARLRALGNAVVPAVGELVGRVARSALAGVE